MNLRRVVIAVLSALAVLLFLTVAFPVFARDTPFVGPDPNPAELSRAINAFVGGLLLLGIVAWLDR